MIDFILLFFLVVCAIAAVRMKDLLSAIIILGAYSLVMAVVWTRMNAVDVAFTEASVGAGITSVLLLAALSRTQRGEDDRRRRTEDRRHDAEDTRQDMEDRRRGAEERRRKTEFSTRTKKTGISAHSLLSLIVVIVTGAVLVYGTIDMPDYGDPDAPANLHVAPRYIERSYKDTGAENFVTAVLASYRGYDTLGETTVIFTAGICVILLLRRKREQ
ncbi:MAG TPA: DUF4040 domain-containing protein [Nitrospirae bacterium]|nr:DUF4040 domain-containing protein [Nitrospirota bacterium]